MTDEEVLDNIVSIKQNSKIKINKAKCCVCGDIIESETRHDFKWCKCKKFAVDGGKSYLKRCFTEKWEELSEYED